MPYCTEDDIKNSGIPEDDLIDLTDDNNQGVVNSAVVASAISRADAMINGSLTSRYEVPIDPVPDILNLLAIDLAVYFVYGHRPHIETPERVTAAFKTARTDLEKMQKGLLQLQAVPTKSGTASSASVSSNERVFSRDSMRDLL